jgi:hypothetical protein
MPIELGGDCKCGVESMWMPLLRLGNGTVNIEDEA